MKIERQIHEVNQDGIFEIEKQRDYLATCELGRETQIRDSARLMVLAAMMHMISAHCMYK
jgi:hypothetical protein